MAILAVALWAACGVAQAQSIVPKLDADGRKGEVARTLKEKTQAQFESADANKDDKLSREEVAVHFRYMAENFDKRDTDKDGFLDWEEFVGHSRWPK
jgi:hypothetical protein